MQEIAGSALLSLGMFSLSFGSDSFQLRELSFGNPPESRLLSWQGQTEDQNVSLTQKKGSLFLKRKRIRYVSLTFFKQIIS